MKSDIGYQNRHDPTLSAPAQCGPQCWLVFLRDNDAVLTTEVVDADR